MYFMGLLSNVNSDTEIITVKVVTVRTHWKIYTLIVKIIAPPSGIN